MNNAALIGRLATVRWESCAALLTLFALVAGCKAAKPTSGSDVTTMDTLSSGTVVVHNARRGLWDSASTWQIVVDRRVSNPPGPTPFDLHDMKVDQAGRLYIADAWRQLKRTIHVFDSTGAFVRDVGRRGQGPGEFMGLAGVALDAKGRLIVIDRETNRFSVFDTAGRPVAQFPIPPTKGTASWDWRGTVDSAGHLIDVLVTTDSIERWELVRYDSLFRSIGTSPLPPMAPDQMPMLFRAAKTTSMGPLPFGSAPLVTMTAKPAVWIAMTAVYRLFQLNEKGDTVRIVERTGYDQVAVTQAEKDSSLASLKTTFDLDDSRVPLFKPPVSRIVVDDRENLWVERPTVAQDKGKLWDVFDPVGRFLGAVHSPLPLGIAGRVNPIIRGDRIYTVSLDDAGNQIIVYARIVRPPLR